MPNSVQDHKAARVAREALAERVRMTRAQRQISQEELAKKAGVSRVRVSEIENAGSDPRFSTVARIAEALGLSVSIAPAA